MFGTMSPASWFLVLFSAVASLSPVAAIVRPRVPTTFLGASYNHPISGALKFVNGTADLAVRANGCPTGWAPCSATTCYPLDGSECCSDGTFCTAGTVCQSGGCCPFGEICEGSAGPPITIGGGPVNDPTDTVTFVSDPTGTPTPTPTPSLTHTTTRAVTTIQTRSGTVTQTTGSPTTTHVTFTGTDSDTDTDTDTETIFHTSLGTESTTRTTGSALAGTDGSDALPTNPLSVGGVNGATPTVGGMQRACAVLSALTAIFMIIL
ncbi:hypothetical protein C8Q78DRAFT_993118 [Trametes maxima]|nr:hypothetical protein C8Q78DRAFT_993118 [Trametes maxima]